MTQLRSPHHLDVQQSNRMRPDLDARHQAEAAFHDHKYATGDSFPRHYKLNPTYPVFRRMLNLLPQDLSTLRVLEYGCGSGWITYELAQRGASVSAFDISPEAVAQTTSLLTENGLASRSSVRVMAGESLDYPTETFDVAVGFAILHHLDIAGALSELYRVLKPKGKALFAEPLASNPLIALYRRLTPQFRTADEAPIVLKDLARQASQFSRFEHQDQLVLSNAALALCYVPGMIGLAPSLQRGLMRIDDALLRVAPWMGKWAWYSILTLEK